MNTLYYNTIAENCANDISEGNGMFMQEDYSIGDAWYYVQSDTIHLFCLSAPIENKGRMDIWHMVSHDLRSWENVGLALEKGAPGSWDDLGLATGSVVQHDGKYWMAYTGHHSGDDPMVQRVGMAYSTDLYHWEKLPENPVTEASTDYYEQMATGKRVKVHWRDPFLLKTEEGVFQLVCARRNEGDVTRRGTVGLAKSHDMRNWEILPPLEHDRIAEEMEVPQVYFINGYYYFMFCTLSGHATLPDLLSPEFKNRFPDHNFRCTDYSMVGRSPFGPFHIHGTGEILTEAAAPWFYASQLINFKGEWFLLGTIQDEEGSKISDPYPITANETGIHVPLSAIRGK